MSTIRNVTAQFPSIPGLLLKRGSVRHLYTHAWAVIVTNDIPEWWGRGRIEGTNTHLAGKGFAASYELARKAGESYLSRCKKGHRKSNPALAGHVEIVQVTGVE